jgi:NAD(P)-dependent dehydrogenase (short-subunit alcohol dehydrogenase family)
VVVNLSSYAARDPFPGFAAYGSAKAGVNLLGLSAAREGASIGVRVHTIAPAAVETAMFRGILSEDQYPPEKALAPADVARIILQCVRGDLRYTSGEVIYLSKVKE